MVEEKEVKKPTKQELETIEKSVIQFYRDSRRVLAEMKEIFLKLGSPHVANTIDAAVGSIDIDLTQYDKQKKKENENAESDNQ